jgi:hypothetical protein
VVEVGGKEAGRQSPFEAQLGPGVYSIRVRKDGYKPWTKEVTLRDGDRPTIQVALDPGTALLSVGSQPPGLGVQLDGKPLGQVTPLELQVAAGPHALVVTNAAGISWSQNFTAEVDGKYSYVALLTTTRRTAAAAVVAAVAKPPPPAPERAERNDRSDRVDHVERTERGDRGDRTAAKRPGAAPARIAGKEAPESELRMPEPGPEPPPVKPEPVAPPPSALPPESRPRPAAPPAAPPKAAPLVAPNAVTKVGGEIPTMRVTGVTEPSTDVIAKMCIDEHGRVASVKIIRALPQITDDLQRNLSTWRYKPYSNAAGEASPACFPLTLRVVFKRD